MKEDTRRLLLVTAFGVTLFVALSHLNTIQSFFIWIWNLLLPLTLGGVLAFFFNVPATGIERGINRLFSRARHKPGLRLTRTVSVLAVLAILALVAVLLGTLVVPTVASSISVIADQVQQRLPAWAEALGRYGVDTSSLQEKLLSLDKSQVLENLVNHTGSFFSSALDAASAALGAMGTFVIALVLSVYLLAEKQSLARQGTKLLHAYLPTRIADRACRVGTLIADTYARFLSGQCVEALILAGLMFLAFVIFRLPYAGLVAVLTAVCAFIPYIGAFLSCFVAVLLNLMVDPFQALMSFVVFQAVQFVEGQFIYPRVVGGSIGLPSLWTLVAAVLGGKLFGVLGMIFFIPAFAVLYSLLREGTAARLRQSSPGPASDRTNRPQP